jgi:hypothetical protein
MAVESVVQPAGGERAHHVADALTSEQHADAADA